MKKNILSALGGGAIGGAVVAVAVSVFGLGQTTVVQQSADSSQSAAGRTAVAQQSGPLSARDIYKRDADGVVFIKANVVQESTDAFGFQNRQQGAATGSGFVISDKGLILTNNHVVNGASGIEVQFNDKTSATAQVVGRDESTDLALLKVDPKGLDLQPLKLGNSATLQVGDPTLAIGNPFGLERTLTTGVVSAVRRTINAPNGFSIDGVIQTDAAINPGNSGGPLINSRGEVVGINSQIQTGGGGGGNVGIGFAVPINTAKEILSSLEQGKRVQRGWLGVETATIDKSLADLKLPASQGALIQKVVPKSPAAKAGLKGGDRQVAIAGTPILVGGDVIVKINGKEIKGSDDLQGAIAGAKPNEEVSITIKRGNETRDVQVKLGDRPTEPARN